MRGAFPVSDRQSALLDAIRAHVKETGDAPSAVQLAAALGMSRQRVTRMLEKLEARGYVADEPIVVRAGKWRCTGKRPPPPPPEPQNGMSSDSGAVDSDERE